MLCRESKRIVGAYVDNEVDLLTGLALEDHLAICADCSRAVEEQRSIKNLVQGVDLKFPCPPDFKQEILRNLIPADRAPSNILRWPRVPLRAWTAATAAIAVIFLAAFLILYSRQSQRHVLDEVVDNHIRSMLANHLADVPSSDQHTVKPWFNGKLDFSPKVQDFNDKGFPLVGGRLDYMDNQTVSVLVYKRRQHIINVFSYPSSAEYGPLTTEKKGYNLVHWATHGMEYWTISDLNIAELQDLTTLLRQ